MYQEVVKILLMDMADTALTAARTRRLKELRGTRTLRAMAATMSKVTDGEVDVTPQAISNWEKDGHVSRKHAQAYDDALGAGGEVLSMFGYAATTGATVASLDAKLDAIREELGELVDIAKRIADDRGGPRDRTPTSRRRPASP